MRGYGIILKVDGTVEKRIFKNAEILEELQEIVGGWIEAVPGWDKFEGRKCWVVCNEEGKNEGLDINTNATMLWAQSF